MAVTTSLISLHSLLHCGGECGCDDIADLTSCSASLWWGVGGVWLLRHHLSHFILCFTVVGSGGSVAVMTLLTSLHALLHCGGEWGECGCDDIADLTSCSAPLQWVGSVVVTTLLILLHAQLHCRGWGWGVAVMMSLISLHCSGWVGSVLLHSCHPGICTCTVPSLGVFTSDSKLLACNPHHVQNSTSTELSVPCYC